jgi:hypothetical protein
MTHKVVGYTNAQVERMVQYLVEGNSIEDLAILYLEALSEKQIKELDEEVSQLEWSDAE